MVKCEYMNNVTSKGNFSSIGIVILVIFGNMFRYLCSEFKNQG